MYELDSSWKGFEWINADDSYRSIFSFIRKSKDGTDNLLFVVNFTPVEYSDYRVGTACETEHTLVLSNNAKKYLGNGKTMPKKYMPDKQKCDGRDYSIPFSLQPYGVAVFAFSYPGTVKIGDKKKGTKK